MATMINMRKIYGETLVKVGAANPNVVALSADVSNSDFSYLFAEAYPERFFNVGIAEQSLVDVAAGLALSGKIPFANAFAIFLATRALEMVRTHLCYGRANVKLMGAYAGLSDSFDGPTHNSITDLAFMRALPNMTVITPADTAAVEKLLPQVADWDGPVYFRLNRNDVPLVYDPAVTLTIGSAHTLRAGRDLTLIGCGLMVARCLEAADQLQAEGLSVRVLDLHTLKPLDTDTILRAARETGAIVTAEEHSILGGLGAAVAETTAEGCPVPVVRVGIHDQFAESGPYDAILDRYGMSIQHILEAARKALALKTKS